MDTLSGEATLSEVIWPLLKRGRLKKDSSFQLE